MSHALKMQKKSGRNEVLKGESVNATMMSRTLFQNQKRENVFTIIVENRISNPGKMTGSMPLTIKMSFHVEGCSNYTNVLILVQLTLGYRFSPYCVTAYSKNPPILGILL
jgi:hypothetical protein